MSQLNQLNSVIIEGDVESIAATTNCSIIMQLKNRYKGSTAIYSVTVHQERTIEAVWRWYESKARKDSAFAGGLRIVGHLETTPEHGLAICAEHIEFKQKKRIAS